METFSIRTVFRILRKYGFDCYAFPYSPYVYYVVYLLHFNIFLELASFVFGFVSPDFFGGYKGFSVFRSCSVPPLVFFQVAFVGDCPILIFQFAWYCLPHGRSTFFYVLDIMTMSRIAHVLSLSWVIINCCICSSLCSPFDMSGCPLMCRCRIWYVWFLGGRSFLPF